jgi:hypothetical protein
VLAVAFSSGHLLAQLSKEAAIAKAEAILKNLQDGKAAEVVKEFDARMAQEIPEAKLQAGWSNISGQLGAFKGIKERREGLIEGRQAVELILEFEKETAVQRAVFDKDGKISGLVFRPASAAVLPPNK